MSEYAVGKDVKKLTEARPPKLYSRRKFLGALVAAGTVAAVPLGIESTKGQLELHSQAKKREFEKLADKAESVITGPVNISKKGPLRTSPAITDPGIMSNTYGWEDIEKVNGVPIDSVDEFIINNVPLIKGDNMDGPGQGEWIPVLVTKKGLLTSLTSTWDDIAWLPRSGLAERAGTVVMDRENGARFKEIQRRDSTAIYFKDDTKILKSDLNKVNPIPKEKST
jgi:hypothetical protein